MTDDSINRGEDGWPMLSFPSMEDDNPKKKNLSTKRAKVPRGETGEPMIEFKGPKKYESFDISDRSEQNEQTAKEALIKKWGYGYDKQGKNAIEILQFADENYLEDLEKTGLGNYPPLIIALNELGEELQPKYKEANKPGSMKDTSLKAFQADARERVNQLISDVEADYATRRGGINR
jgi:hypothetical protein